MGWLLNHCMQSECVVHTSRTVVKKKGRITVLPTNTWLLSGGRQGLLLQNIIQPEIFKRWHVGIFKCLTSI